MMRHVISQCFQVWLLPPGIFILMGFVGLLMMLRWRRLGMLWITVTLGSLWLFSMPAVAWLLIKHLQDQYPPLALSKFTSKHSGVIIVLGEGGSKNALEYPSHESVADGTLSRLNYAVYLHRKTGLPILASGGGDIDASTPTADLMLNILKENYNVRIDPRLKESESLDTADEARIIAILLKQYKLTNVYLVTNAWHMPRAMYAFNKMGVKVIPAPMGYIAARSEDQVSSYLPSFSALHTTKVALREYMGFLWYQVIMKREL